MPSLDRKPFSGEEITDDPENSDDDISSHQLGKQSHMLESSEGFMDLKDSPYNFIPSTSRDILNP